MDIFIFVWFFVFVVFVLFFVIVFMSCFRILFMSHRKDYKHSFRKWTATINTIELGR